MPLPQPKAPVGFLEAALASIDDALPVDGVVKALDEVAAARAAETAALVRLADAEDTLRAIAAGEVDAFVVSDAGKGRRVFTLSTADRPYRMFVENMRDGAATLSAAGVILYANRRLAELLTSSRETIVGAPLARFLPGGLPVKLDEICGPDGLGATVELDLVDGSGNLVPVLVKTSLLEMVSERLTCLTITDLTAQKYHEREIARLSHSQAERLSDLQGAQAALTEQATHDALTGLPNRGLLIDRVEQALAQARRSGKWTVVLFVDLDRFKHINDTHGHAAGDTMLRQVADHLTSVLRPMDTVARIGGDEFAVLALNVDDHLHAVDIGERLVGELIRQPDQNDEGISIGASVGISVSVAGRGNAEVLLREADTAMYKAKSLGGGRAEVFDQALGRQVHERSLAQRLLRSALEDGRVVNYYQPIVELGSGCVTGFEALARIAEIDGSVLGPGAFIPVAEDTGQVVPLGERVLSMACREAVLWGVVHASPWPLTIAVNLSGRQFQPGDLPEIVERLVLTSRIDAGRLHLELTETAIVDLHPNTLDQLGRIRDLGVEIGLDDFGTGYASLTHLRRLPLTFVKVDQSFVQGLGTELGDERIVAAVVDLAANLGLRSIAEGVETHDQLARLRELGCDQAQGYLFGRPVPPSDLQTAFQNLPW